MSADQDPAATFVLEPRGPFALEEAGRFGFGPHVDPQWDGVMRLAFCLDGYHDQVGVEARQDGNEVQCVVRTADGHDLDLATVRDQVARVLSLDHDAREYVAVGQRDPVVRRLLDVAPGLRPVLFSSPYEAAAWAVLSARRPAVQMAEVRRQMSEEHGAAFDLAGKRLAAFPTPRQMLDVVEVPGLSAEKVTRLHAVARAAQDGQLDAERLREMTPEAAMADLRSIPGIGPFYAALIVIRATGSTDVLPTAEPRLIEMITRLYDLPDTPTSAELEAIAEPWRPFRTWVSVLIRAAGRRLLNA